MSAKLEETVPIENEHDDKSIASSSSTYEVMRQSCDGAWTGDSMFGSSDSEDINKGKEAIDRQEKLVGKETKLIERMKKLVFGVLITVAALGSLGAFFLVQDQQCCKWHLWHVWLVLDPVRQLFCTHETRHSSSPGRQFREQAHEIKERTQNKLSDAVGSLRSLSKTITASSRARWLIFSSRKDEQVTESVVVAGLQNVMFAPLVMEAENEEWESFSQQQQEADPLVNVINAKITNYKNVTDDGL